MPKQTRALRSAKKSGSPFYCPDAGDIIWIDLDPQAGREQAGRRPALILTPKAYNALTGLCVGCPVTNQSKGYPFEVTIPQGSGPTGVVLADHVKNFDWKARRSEFMAQAPRVVLVETRAKLKALLQIS